MTEDFTPQEPSTEGVPPEGATPTESQKGPRGRLGAFYATTIGKVVVIGCALSLLGAILAVVAVVVLGFLAVGAVEEGLEQAIVDMESTEQPAVAADESSESDEGTSVPEAVPNSEVYTFRDVFVPLLSTQEAEASEDTSAAQSEPDTIYLLDITSLNGVPTAVLLWNGSTYYLGEGDQIPATPWLVMDVRTDSVVMLYGDTQVTLYIGQGMAAK